MENQNNFNETSNGNKQKKPFILIGIVVILIIAILVVAYNIFKEFVNPNLYKVNKNTKNLELSMVKNFQRDESLIPSNNKITYENFQNIQMGVSYEDAVNVFGEPSSSDIKDTTNTYFFSVNDDSLKITLAFENNKLVKKIYEDFDYLYVKPVYVDIDTFKSIGIGSTLDDIKSIVGGDGYNSYEHKSPETNVITSGYTFSFNDNDGLNNDITCYFEDGKLVDMIQYNLLYSEPKLDALDTIKYKNFNKTKLNMTLSQVESKFGKKSEYFEKNKDFDIYEYYNPKNEVEIMFYFRDGKLFKREYVDYSNIYLGYNLKNTESIDNIQNGKSLSEIQKILGSDGYLYEEFLGSDNITYKSYLWHNDSKYSYLYFEDDVLTNSEIYDYQ